jgi:hypothetical protein
LGFLEQKWNNFWTDAAMNVGKVFSNIYDNITSIMSDIWAYISSAGTATLDGAWTPILSGFQKTVTQLPDIPPRVISDYEIKLQTEIDTMQKTFVDGAGQAIADAIARSKVDDLPALSGATGLDSRTVEQEELASETVDKGRSSFVVESLDRGSEAALKSIFASQQRDKTPKDQLAEQKKANGFLKQIAAASGGQPQIAGAIA